MSRVVTRPIPIDRAVYVEHEIVIIECANCSIDFGVGKGFEKRRRDDHDSFFCPNGHSNYYPQDNEAEKLRKQLEQTERWLRNQRAATDAARDQARAAEYARRGQKAANTKLRKRVAAGVCPCCNRSFQNLARHMAGQHPDYPKTD